MCAAALISSRGKQFVRSWKIVCMQLVKFIRNATAKGRPQRSHAKGTCVTPNKKKKATAKISLLKLLVNQVLSAIGSSVCSSLPDSLRDPVIGGNSLRQSLFATYWCIERIRGFTTMRYINRLLLTFAYLLAGYRVTVSMLKARTYLSDGPKFWPQHPSLNPSIHLY